MRLQKAFEKFQIIPVISLLLVISRNQVLIDYHSFPFPYLPCTVHTSVHDKNHVSCQNNQITGYLLFSFFGGILYCVKTVRFCTYHVRLGTVIAGGNPLPFKYDEMPVLVRQKYPVSRQSDIMRCILFNGLQQKRMKNIPYIPYLNTLLKVSDVKKISFLIYAVYLPSACIGG